MGAQCKCKKKCFQKVGEEIRKEFYNLMNTGFRGPFKTMGLLY